MPDYHDPNLTAQERAEALTDTLTVQQQAEQLKYDAPAILPLDFPPTTGGTRGFTELPARVRRRCSRRR